MCSWNVRRVEARWNSCQCSVATYRCVCVLCVVSVCVMCACCVCVYYVCVCVCVCVYVDCVYLCRPVTPMYLS